MSDKFKVTIGMSVAKEGSPDFFDGGLVYHNLPYDMMVAIEGVFAKYAAEITKAIEPLAAELVQMGVEEAAKRAGEQAPNGVIR